MQQMDMIMYPQDCVSIDDADIAKVANSFDESNEAN
jgi:hypothetical protein